jgi:hypothetical protein
MSTQYRLVQSGKTASGGCSAGQGSSEPVAPRIYFFTFCIYGFHMILSVNRDYFLNSIKQLIVMLKCCVLFEGRAEFLNIIQTGFGSKGFNGSSSKI